MFTLNKIHMSPLAQPFYNSRLDVYTAMFYRYIKKRCTDERMAKVRGNDLIEIKHLKTLTVLRDTGSLTATATTLCLTQSALSHQLKDLEQRLGSQLFLRKTRPVKFTAEGEILLRLADDLFPRLAQAEHELASFKEDTNGRLHMAIECHSLLPVADAST